MEAAEYYYHGVADMVASAAGEHFAVDDLLDFSNEDATASIGDQGVFLESVATNSADSSTVTNPFAVERCNSSVCGDNAGSNYCLANTGGAGFYGACNNLSGELSVPYDDVAELEWLSNFVEDSFSAKQPSLSLHFLPTTGPTKPHTPDSSSTNALARHRPLPPVDSSTVVLPESSPLPSKSRSKRPRAAPGDWNTRLLHLTDSPSRASSSKREAMGTDTAPRRCLHCAAEKTPQWRTGPMGPKTLCNACGVRYKSGRLVPEYRPAASPTFVSTKHSNSHRKVLELRRQKDLHRVHPHPHPLTPPHHHHSPFVGTSPTYGLGDHEYLTGGGTGFRHMI
ncbi:hypothetical protein MLD38_005235 [Melastoma candidum]|uniref:Uncharacterized protein n=1 Tax=Melastoma candidum TaxID=119954 RepID=A0ACB9SGS3_9MYRT|nr:hypothetical protein MLD38_005235 [Melastoma candidum]